MSDPRVAILNAVEDLEASAEVKEAMRAGAEALRILADLRLHHLGGARVGNAIAMRRLPPEAVDRAVALVGHVLVLPYDYDAALERHRAGVAEAVAEGEFEQT